MPLAEPVTLEFAKAQCGLVDDNTRDELISSYVAAAREWVENYTGKALVRRQFIDHWDYWPRFLELRRGPDVEILEVGFTDTDGQASVYTEYVASTDRLPARVYPSLSGWWPSLGLYGGVSVTYTAGYAVDEVPFALVQAMLLLVTHWFENRGAVALAVPQELQFGVASLCDQYRMPV